MATKTRPKAAPDRQHALDATLTVNRRASYDYELLKSYDAGIVLAGPEIKAIREGKANIREAYVRVERGEAFVMNMHIARYSASAGFSEMEPTRRRKLLLHKAQIDELAAAQDQKGLTLIPTRLHLVRGKAKLEVAVARGKRQYDKREAIAKREADREVQRAGRQAR